ARGPGQTRLGPPVGLDGLLGHALPAPDERVGVDQAVQVTHLVLETAGEETGALHGPLLTVLIEAGDLRPVRTAGGDTLTGAREAALPLGAVIGGHGLGDLGGLQDRVDEAATVHGALIIGAVEHEDAFGHPDLVGGQADTVGD